jgi:hypothetical protein
MIAGLLNAGVAQLVERNLAKVEVASSRLVSRSKFRQFVFLTQAWGGAVCTVELSGSVWRDSKAVMQRIANPFSPVRLWVAPPKFL